MKVDHSRMLPVSSDCESDEGVKQGNRGEEGTRLGGIPQIESVNAKAVAGSESEGASADHASMLPFSGDLVLGAARSLALGRSEEASPSGMAKEDSLGANAAAGSE